MIEFILGFCLAIAIVAILSRQQAIKDIQKMNGVKYQEETIRLMEERNEIDFDKINEFRKIQHTLNDIVTELESIRNKREG